MTNRQSNHTLTLLILGGLCACLILLVGTVIGLMLSPSLNNSTEVAAKQLLHLVEQAEESVVVRSIEETVARSENSVARIKGEESGGTGFVIRPNVLVTNKHVIEDEFLELLEITFPSAPEPVRGPYKATLLYTDPDWDIAFLEVESSLPPLPLAFPHQFGRGREIVIIGHPIGLQNVVTTGVLSSHDEIDGKMYYQLSASINPGNSGGPVMNRNGEVLGVVTFSRLRSGGRRVEGISACISINDVMASLIEMEQLTEQEYAAQNTEYLSRINAFHRARVAFGKLVKAQRTYLLYMEMLAVASGRERESSDAVSDRVAAGMRQDYLRSEELSEIQQVLQDTNLPESLRKDLNAFFVNCMEIRGYVNNPRGLDVPYSQKLSELRATGRRLQFELQLELGVPVEE